MYRKALAIALCIFPLAAFAGMERGNSQTTLQDSNSVRLSGQDEHASQGAPGNAFGVFREVRGNGFAYGRNLHAVPEIDGKNVVVALSLLGCILSLLRKRSD